MSDAPAPGEPATGPGIFAALRDVRWLSALIWAALLAALLVTSIHGIDAFTQGSAASRVLNLTAATLPQADLNHRVAVTGLILSAGAAVTLVLAWLSFVRVTRAMILAYASEDGKPETSPVAAEWIAEEPLETGRLRLRSPIGEVILLLGLTWAILVITPAVINIVAAYGSPTAVVS